ncbi:putative peptidase M41, FtsH extracellular [Helianthus annuus]|nr:putative peptidase M41, FtsH extracellular [Helianthus annuus]
MIFTRISRCISRSSHSTFRRNVRGLISTELSSANAYIQRFDAGATGFVRSYLSSKGQIINPKTCASDVNYFGFRRLFCNEAPKKRNYENYHPKGKKEVPKGEGQKSGSKGDSGKNDDGDNFMKNYQSLISPLMFFAFVLSTIFLTPQEQQQVLVLATFQHTYKYHTPNCEFSSPLNDIVGYVFQISFQEFKNKLLEPGLVDHIVVSNKSVAKVYVKASNANTIQTGDDVIQGPDNGNRSRGQSSYYKYYFNIGSVETFEEKLEEAQEALGIDPHNYIPVTYSSETNWVQELIRFIPTLLLLGTLYFMGKRMQINVGQGGKGGRGIFNIGKAQVTKLDKNSKNKASFRFGYLCSLSLLSINIL